MSSGKSSSLPELLVGYYHPFLSLLSGGWSSRRCKPVESEGDVVDIGAKFGVTVGSDSDSSDAEFAPENEQRDSADSGSGDYSSGEEGGDEAEPDDTEEGAKVECKEKEKEEEEEVEEKGGAEEEGGGEVSGGMEPHSETEEKENEATSVAEGTEGDPDVKKEVQMSVEEHGKETPPPTDMGATAGEDDDTGSVSEKPEGPEAQAKDEYNPLVVRRSNRAIKPTKDVDLYLLGAKFGIDVEGGEGEGSDVEIGIAHV